MIGSLNALDFSTLRLRGLGASGALSQQDVFTLMRPLIPASRPGAIYGTVSFTDADLNQVIAAILAKYIVLKSNQSPSNRDQVQSDITAAVVAAKGYKDALLFKDSIASAFDTLNSRGYTVLPASELRAEPQTPQAVVAAATTPTGGAEPTTIQSFTQAMDAVTAIAPTLAVATQRQAAQALVGKKVYVKKSVWPWVVFGVGVASVVGLGLYFVTRGK